eukprot:GILI01002651.1.p1 GENE.GILI01002651.1~~GILI01002651.1.p1  ORF type:complete len:1110 (-),score=404.88 GILI01002651.1:160-3150(-)
MDEKVDAVLAPVIGRNTIKRGRARYIKLGDKELSYNKDFRLFMHTKLSNPHYPPEIQAEATLINFTVTEAGLEDQLLSLVVKKERPDLAEQKVQLIQQQNEFKIKLKELEDSLLEKLTNAQGDILEDVELIENLETTKRIATEIGEKVVIAKETEVKINEASEAYRPAASRGALVFFLMNELNKIHSFYMYSLEAFVVVVKRAIDIVAAAEAKKLEEGQEADPLDKRVNKLTDSITYCAFNYVRRGLLERHKLIVASMLTLRVLTRMGICNAAEVDLLIQGKIATDAPPCPESLKFLPEIVWGSLKALESIPVFAGLCQNMEQDSLAWRKFYGEEKAELCDLPRAYKEISRFHRLLLLRAMRKDRITSALTMFVYEQMGAQYIEQPPFNMAETYKETDPATPIFFVLFPGVDPTPDVERIGETLGFTAGNGKFVNISMGQGQEQVAELALTTAAKEGGWVMLQNVHLMQTWLKTLERSLEVCAESAHADFRCFISSEPPPLPDMKIIPESILQNCVKVANEAPQDMKANLRRAWAHFDQDRLNNCNKPSEFKALLFALCYFHSLVLGRRKFGSQGWSRVYNFNDGDLTICADVLTNYLERYATVPYEDVRYIYDEIMYGGHITDNWDRRTNNTYLKEYIRPELLSGLNLAVGFKSPDPAKFDYEAYSKYIEEKLPIESPNMFGFHANAEIGYLTTMADTLFTTILETQGAGGRGSGGSKKEDIVAKIIVDYLARLPENFSLRDIAAKIKEKSPYVVVAMQECERMNSLLSEIRRSLQELQLGLQGALNISDAMEALSNALFLGRVPANWEKYAYPSKKPLAPWFIDLLERVKQLEAWTADLNLPKSLWISGLFNPMSFLTAVMQVTARKNGFPLDNMALQTNVTSIVNAADVTAAPADGAYVHGFFLEGAAWELGTNGAGYLIDSKLKELHPALPVVHVVAVPIEQKVTESMYMCPVYVTSMRGPTFVFTANLQMEQENQFNKWVLAGVALLMTDD